MSFLSKIRAHYKKVLLFSTVSIFVMCILTALYLQHIDNQHEIDQRSKKEVQLKAELAKTQQALHSIQNEDQVLINKKNKEEIENIQNTYKQTVKAYESLLEVKPGSKEYTELTELIALSLSQLSEKNYSSAQATLTILSKQIDEQKKSEIAAFTIPATVQESAIPPSNGYARQQVNTSVGNYMVDIISADLSTTKVIVDTASESDCLNDCPVFSLSDYVSRNGAFAGINGSYFCPAAYPSCAGKTNSFDTLLMNKNKKYFNSDNNVYSAVPAVIFSNGSIRFVSRSQDWGRDTGIDSMIANQPLLVFGGNNVFAGDGEVKRAGKGSRSFVGNKGKTVYIGVVHNVSAAEMAYVLHTMGMENALNLDSGGSTALWSGGYKVGPGRNLPNAILFLRK